MNNKQLVLIICLSPWMLSSCTAQNKADPPYLKALHTLRDMNSTFVQIVSQEKYFEYDGSNIKLIGYINNIDSRIYLSSDFNDPLQLDSEEYKKSWSILLYDNYHDGKLLKVIQCGNINNSLIEIYGTFHVNKSTNNEVTYYLTDIEKRYNFDTRPRSIGTGEKYQCYPEAEKFRTGTN